MGNGGNENPRPCPLIENLTLDLKMEKIALAQLKSEDPVWHPAFGECQYMGPAENMQGWVFWGHVDEEGRHKEFVEDDPDAKVLPLWKFLMACVPIPRNFCEADRKIVIGKAISVYISPLIGPMARISWWHGESVATLFLRNEMRTSVPINDLAPLFDECKQKA